MNTSPVLRSRMITSATGRTYRIDTNGLAHLVRTPRPMLTQERGIANLTKAKLHADDSPYAAGEPPFNPRAFPVIINEATGAIMNPAERPILSPAEAAAIADSVNVTIRQLSRVAPSEAPSLRRIERLDALLDGL